MGHTRDPTAEIGECKAARRTRAVVTAHLDALVGSGNGGAALANDVALTVMETGEVTHGRTAVAALLSYLHCTAFAAPPAITTLVAGTEHAMVEAEFAGLHQEEFAGILPAGRRVHVSYAVAYDLREDTITAVRLYLSLDELVRQLRQP
jgi:predicted ester cyclase